MKGVSEASIRRWHLALEKGGHIERLTWRVHVKTEKGLEIRTKRKIYVDQGGKHRSNKKAERSEMSAHCERSEMSGIKEEPFKEELSKENIVQTMTSTTEKKDTVLSAAPISEPAAPVQRPQKSYANALAPDARKLHDRIVRHKLPPGWGDGPRSEDVAAWMLPRDNPLFTVAQVEDAYKTYRQDAAEAESRGDVVDNMGGRIRSILNTGRKSKNQDFESNKSFSERMAAKFDLVTALKNYVKIQIGSTDETMQYSLPHPVFHDWLEHKTRQMEFEAMVNS